MTDKSTREIRERAQSAQEQSRRLADGIAYAASGDDATIAQMAPELRRLACALLDDLARVVALTVGRQRQ